MMQGKIFCGGQMEARCPHTETEAQKYIGEGCSNGIGQARQGFDACRVVSLCEGHGEKADAGFVDAQGSFLTGRIFAAFRAKLWYLSDITVYGEQNRWERYCRIRCFQQHC